MATEWANLSASDREAFAAWRAERSTPKRYADMTATEKAAFHRATGVPKPRDGAR